ncbi:hypothetical protein M7I_1129 [Glarea lozoyensis 74030]|uniref:Uncharacterized protein n=1 Tax=Glarea lozoyensis (strain ATCC 74030 / MF5533) TaxID=1104152 RepID=H0EF88_GLAL7|nr:hypothetical protein M7I_1129 [Glarea lozoyensis 74030]
MSDNDGKKEIVQPFNSGFESAKPAESREATSDNDESNPHGIVQASALDENSENYVTQLKKRLDSIEKELRSVKNSRRESLKEVETICDQAEARLNQHVGNSTSGRNVENAPMTANVPAGEELTDANAKDENTLEEKAREARRNRDELRCLVEFMDKDMSDIFDIKLAASTHTLEEVAFEHLWQVYKPGIVIYGSNQRGDPNRCQAYHVLHVTGGRDRSKTQKIRYPSVHWQTFGVVLRCVPIRRYFKPAPHQASGVEHFKKKFYKWQIKFGGSIINRSTDADRREVFDALPRIKNQPWITDVFDDSNFEEDRRNINLIEDITEVQSQRIRSGLENLVLPKGHRMLLQALIKNQVGTPKKTSGNSDDEMDEFSMDVVKGKGKGLIILLHGVPGVGKTSTAECVAAQLRRPLLPITTGNPRVLLIRKFYERHWAENIEHPSRRWNGRQIKNAFQTALALANWDFHDAQESLRLERPLLKAAHFDRVAETSAHFDDYISDIHGLKEEDTYGILAEREEVRKDTNQGIYPRSRVPAGGSRKQAPLHRRGGRTYSYDDFDDASPDEDDLESRARKVPTAHRGSRIRGDYGDEEEDYTGTRSRSNVKSRRGAGRTRDHDEDEIVEGDDLDDVQRLELELKLARLKRRKGSSHGSEIEGKDEELNY